MGVPEEAGEQEGFVQGQIQEPTQAAEQDDFVQGQIQVPLDARPGETQLHVGLADGSQLLVTIPAEANPGDTLVLCGGDEVGWKIVVQAKQTLADEPAGTPEASALEEGTIEGIIAVPANAIPGETQINVGIDDDSQLLLTVPLEARAGDLLVLTGSVESGWKIAVRSQSDTGSGGVGDGCVQLGTPTKSAHRSQAKGQALTPPMPTLSELCGLEEPQEEPGQMSGVAAGVGNGGARYSAGLATTPLMPTLSQLCGPEELQEESGQMSGGVGGGVTMLVPLDCRPGVTQVLVDLDDGSHVMVTVPAEVAPGDTLTLTWHLVVHAHVAGAAAPIEVAVERTAVTKEVSCMRMAHKWEARMKDLEGRLQALTQTVAADLVAPTALPELQRLTASLAQMRGRVVEERVSQCEGFFCSRMVAKEAVSNAEELSGCLEEVSAALKKRLDEDVLSTMDLMRNDLRQAAQEWVARLVSKNVLDGRLQNLKQKMSTNGLTAALAEVREKVTEERAGGSGRAVKLAGCLMEVSSSLDRRLSGADVVRGDLHSAAHQWQASTRGLEAQLSAATAEIGMCTGELMALDKFLIGNVPPGGS